MAYIEPKTNWIASDAPVPSDFNRIEGNIDYLNDKDSTLQGNVDSEAATRLVNDTTLQNNIDVEAATRLADDNAIGARIDSIISSTGIGAYAWLGLVTSSISFGSNYTGLNWYGGGPSIAGTWRACFSETSGGSIYMQGLFQRVS